MTPTPTPTPVSADDLDHIPNLAWNLDAYQRTNNEPVLRGKVVVVELAGHGFCGAQEGLPEHQKPLISRECRAVQCAVLIKSEHDYDGKLIREIRKSGSQYMWEPIRWEIWVADLRTKTLSRSKQGYTQATLNNRGYSSAILAYLDGLHWEMVEPPPKRP